MLIFKGKTARCLRTFRMIIFKNDPSIILKYQEKGWNNEELYIHYLKYCLPVVIRGKEYKKLLMNDNMSFHLGAAVSTVCVSVMKMEPFCLLKTQLFCVIHWMLPSTSRGWSGGWYLVDSYTDGEIRIPKNLLRTWIQEVWKNDITNEIIRNSFKSCGLGVSPVDSSQRIYWKELAQGSLQSLEMLLQWFREHTGSGKVDNWGTLYCRIENGLKQTLDESSAMWRKTHWLSFLYCSNWEKIVLHTSYTGNHTQQSYTVDSNSNQYTIQNLLCIQHNSKNTTSIKSSKSTTTDTNSNQDRGRCEVDFVDCNGGMIIRVPQDELTLVTSFSLLLICSCSLSDGDFQVEVIQEKCLPTHHHKSATI